MGGWKRVKLGEIAQLLTGFPFDGHKYSSEGIRVLRGENVSIGKLRWDADKRWNQLFDRKSEYSLQVDDIVVGMDGSRVGRNRAMITSADLPMLIAQRVACVRAKDAAYQKFLYYTILSNAFLEYIESIKTGSAIPHVSLSQLADYAIPLPDLPTQRRIAAVLGALDDKIEVNRKICENLEAQAQALFKAWFVDFEPFGGKRPEGWKMGKLGDVADCNPYRKLEKGVEATCVEMADLVTNGSFPSGCSVRVYNGGMKFTNGDTIIARITPCFENGKAAFVNFLKEGEVAFGSTEYVVIASKSVAPRGMFYSLVKTSDFLTYAKSRMVGSSGRQRFSASDVAEYPMVIATNDAYEKLAPVYDSLMAKIAQCGRESRALAAMRDALLPKLMSGEVSI